MSSFYLLIPQKLPLHETIIVALKQLYSTPGANLSDFTMLFRPSPADSSRIFFPQIHRIRQAIEPTPRHPQILVTRREAGYLLQVTPTVVELDPFPPLVRFS